MNTCKVTLRVLIAHRIYILIYLIGIGVMMLALGGSELSASRPVGDTFTPGKATWRSSTGTRTAGEWPTRCAPTSPSTTS
ncbi:hypothetical protein [Bifidobacterium callitrichos]|uniref:hypothetical protein n=1 Tax=Bifidobacterium callitrichos TaxID=762209 RepID=UPI001EE66CEE|nr:hypothetical protein [Bifidobacterium callitrichos]